MAMIRYANTPSDFGAVSVTVDGTANLVQFGDVTCDVYLDADTGSTQLDSDSMEDESGVGIDQVSGATGEVIRFKIDDAVTGGKDVWATPDSGTTWYKFAPYNGPLVDRVAAVEAAGTPDMDDLGDVSASSPSDGDGLYYNSTSSLWVAGAAGSSATSLPPGGTDGQLLAKQSSSDGDADWETVVALPPGGTDGQLLAKQSSSDGDADWETHYTVPSGGADEALLAKASASDGDTEWVAGTTYWKVWTGSSAAYAAIGTPDANTLYAITSS